MSDGYNDDWRPQMSSSNPASTSGRNSRRSRRSQRLRGGGTDTYNYVELLDDATNSSGGLSSSRHRRVVVVVFAVTVGVCASYLLIMGTGFGITSSSIFGMLYRKSNGVGGGVGNLESASSDRAAVASFAKALARATNKHCPKSSPSSDEFYELERHDHQPSHGDVCRQVVQNQRLGFECPSGCRKSSDGGAPFCTTERSSLRPCRVPRDERERPYRCDPNGGERGACVLADGPQGQFKGRGVYKDQTCDGQCGDGMSAWKRRGGAACTDDWDCSLAGVCTDGKCVCDGWTEGSGCSYLRFEPVDVHMDHADRGAGASGYNHPQHTSWGGSIVKGSDGMYHMYVSEILCSDSDRQQGRNRRCGLDNWQTLSQVAHAVSDNLTGPYRRHDTLLPPEAHNPTIHISPVDASWNLHYITKSAGPIAVISSTDEGRTWSEPTIVSRNQNPGPVLHTDGSVTMYYRGDGANLPSPTCSDEYVGREECPSLSSPCIGSTKSQPVFQHTAEDPSVFIDKRGNYHMLMNALPYLCVPKHRQGGHAWSRDGRDWSEPRVGAFDTNVRLVGGGGGDDDTMECERRERPQMVLNEATGEPEALVSALVGCPRRKVGGPYGGGVDSFTLVQRMGT